MGVRIRDESGMGLLELLIAMVVLNVGLFAVVGVFNGATVAMGRAATISSATAVADKQMEIYRSLQDCAIWLDPASFPTKGSGSAYEADTKSYTDVYAVPSVPVSFFDKSVSVNSQGMLPWATSSTSSALVVPWNGDIETSCTPTAGVTPPASATQAIQNVPGPDGVSYSVYTYVILAQPADTVGGTYTGTYVKQVTIVVRDPRNSARILAREISLFNPILG
ncbi:MAG: type IV pilus modification PilV family protein [Gaiellaceae bacterium]